MHARNNISAYGGKESIAGVSADVAIVAIPPLQDMVVRRVLGAHCRVLGARGPGRGVSGWMVSLALSGLGDIEARRFRDAWREPWPAVWNVDRGLVARMELQESYRVGR